MTSIVQETKALFDTTDGVVHCVPLYDRFDGIEEFAAHLNEAQPDRYRIIAVSPIESTWHGRHTPRTDLGDAYAAFLRGNPLARLQAVWQLYEQDGEGLRLALNDGVWSVPDADMLIDVVAHRAEVEWGEVRAFLHTLLVVELGEEFTSRISFPSNDAPDNRSGSAIELDDEGDNQDHEEDTYDDEDDGNRA